MKEIPSSHRQAVQRAVQRELNAIFCELQEEVREYLARMRAENSYRRQRAEEEIRSMQSLNRRLEEQVRELEDLNAGNTSPDVDVYARGNLTRENTAVSAVSAVSEDRGFSPGANAENADSDGIGEDNEGVDDAVSPDILESPTR